MKNSTIPFNISLLQIDEQAVQKMRPVRSLDTFEGLTKNFHPDGLFSTQTFGIVGSDARAQRYGYIDLKIDIFHPTIFHAICKLKSLYQDILSSKEFAIWDSDAKDFVKSNALEGKTGYMFFCEHWRNINFEARPSIVREQNILMVEKFKKVAMTSKVLVLPAGLRDLEVDDSGRETSDEINALYYKLVAISNTINPSTVKVSPEAYNSQRMALQNTFVEIYDYILKIVEGKKNLLMGKWASRKIFNGTRNVITSMDTTSSNLNEKGNVGLNNTAIGIYQCMKAMLPVARHALKTKFLGEVFTAVGAPALLVNKKTLQSERVQLKAFDYDQWMTNEGLDNYITNFKEPSIRTIPIEIDNYYLGLLYKGPDGTFKLIHGIDELPEGRNKEDCVPLTPATLFYCSIYAIANNYPLFLTRYPIATAQSIYVSMTYLRSTILSEVRQELGNDWKPMGEPHIAYQFPTDSDFFNSLSPHSSKLAALDADFDGDTSSANIAYSDEAIAEVNKHFRTKIAYVGTDGSFTNNLNTDTIKFVLHNLTSP